MNIQHNYFRLSVLLALLMTSTVATSAVIDTTQSWDGTSGTCCFGEGSTDTYGQTFSVGTTDTVLRSFSFWIDDRTNINAPIEFAAYVMAWHNGINIGDYSHAVGPLLYSSKEQTTSDNSGQGGMEKFTFSTGSLRLQPGEKYVAFISSSLFWNGVNSSGYVGSLGNCCDGTGNVYSGGNFVLIDSGNALLPYITQSGWNQYPKDLAFVATFSAPVPIPPAAWLLLSGLILVVTLERYWANSKRRQWK